VLEQFGVFYRGVILGIMIAAPVGPIGLLCMRRTIQRGLVVGFSTGFGAAFADAFFAAIAAFGVAQITEWMQEYNHQIHIIGGVFILIAALHSWFDKPRPLGPKIEIKVGSAIRALISGFGITLTNPLTLFGTLAVVAAFGESHDHWEALTLVSGVFLGSTAWWITLSGGISLIRHHFTENTIMLVNRITALFLAAIAVWAVYAGISGKLAFNVA
jgi:threonine/homoserine/homoserine lactone efflux protein